MIPIIKCTLLLVWSLVAAPTSTAFQLLSVVSKRQVRSETALNSSERQKLGVVVCPAQFCVPDDYNILRDNLQEVLPDHVDLLFETSDLPRTEWIKVAKQLPTSDFWQSNLSVPKTLDWYFQGIDKAYDRLFARDDSLDQVALVGHSIGGWIGRAMLTDMHPRCTAVSRLARARTNRLITLGTPQYNAESSLVDQTRGLLCSIERQQKFDLNRIDTICVTSNLIQGKLFSTNVDELVAAASYFPLTGNYQGPGDGIVPESLATLPDPRVRVVQVTAPNAPVRHSHVLPTPWNLWNGAQPSIPLPGSSYVTKDIVEQWAPYLLDDSNRSKPNES